MVENSKEYALRWPGHAAYVTERFSGLLARQSLVDVTLICEEQKLRVHKLVLASSSVYFEEILQQDLGQEPIIFLKDLSFEILKAMVEFMYCGETTISHECLPSLLNAANIFKVKELAQLIDPTMDSQVVIKDFDCDAKVQNDNYRSKLVKDEFNEINCMYIDSSDLDKQECSLLCSENDDIVNTNENQSLEDNLIVNEDDHEVEHTLYEEPDEDSERNTETPLSSIESDDEQGKLCTMTAHCTIKKTPLIYCESNVECNDRFSGDSELKPILYEQCCEFTSEPEQTMILSQSSLSHDKDYIECSVDSVDVPNKIGKCTKVYTHKRQKSVDEVKNKIEQASEIVPKPISTDCIDLLDEPSSNDVPTTLLTSLDMESAEYILSLSTENIQSIVGGTFSEQLSLIGQKETDIRSNAKTQISDSNSVNNSNNISDNSQEKELCLGTNESHKPVLRRSMRLHQHDSDEQYSNNNNLSHYNNKEKQLKKVISSNRTVSLIRKKRKIRDLDRKVPDQTNISRIQSVKKNLSNTRKNSKLIIKKNTKSKSPPPSKEKEDQKGKINKGKCEIQDKMDTSNFSIVLSNDLNTVENINRALWGDMSDILECNQANLNMPEYILDREIPFAVGLLPLRTALERMQATLDYQPRKTRSSVSIKHDMNHLKRKRYIPIDTNIHPKRQNIDNNDLDRNTNAVCHIQISTASSPYVKSRKKFLTGHIASLEPAAVINQQ